MKNYAWQRQRLDYRRMFQQSYKMSVETRRKTLAISKVKLIVTIKLISPRILSIFMLCDRCFYTHFYLPWILFGGKGAHHRYTKWAARQENCMNFVQLIEMTLSWNRCISVLMIYTFPSGKLKIDFVKTIDYRKCSFECYYQKSVMPFHHHEWFSPLLLLI